VNTKFLFASVAALVVATPAMAQETSSTFQGGARIEARAGVDDVVLKAGGNSESKVGFVYGTEVGYDYATKSGFVIGAYAGIEGATTKDCFASGTQTFCLKAGRNITAGVRAGGVVAGGLLYAKGGYTNGRVTASFTDTAVPANNASASGNADGWHAGAGYEMSISAHTFAKIEYVYTHYSVDNTLGTSVGLQRHQGLVGFGYRF
jgi:outer membrane immunogenic protein